MSFSYPRSVVVCWKYSLGVAALSGLLSSSALADDRVGTDAPHQERTSAKNVDRFRYGGDAAVPVAVAVATPVPVKKVASKKSAAANKKVAAKKQAEKAKEATPAAAPAVSATPEPKSFRASDIDDSRVGNSAPHQERGSATEAHAARILIWER